MLHPVLNPVPAIVFTPSGLIQGTFHVPAVKSFLAFVNGPEEILKLTEATLPGSDGQHPFVALHKASVLLIVPGGPAPAADAVSRERRTVTCLLGPNCIRGGLDLPPNHRVSDFLLRNRGFIELHDCRVSPRPYPEAGDEAGEAIPLVLVNTAALVGTAEEKEPPLED